MNEDANERIAELEAECAALQAHVKELEAYARIADFAADRAIKRAKKLERQRDGYRAALETLCVMLDNLCGQIELARDIAYSHFGAEGLSMEDLRRRFDESVR